MSRETPDSVKREVIRLYFSGLSYDEIATKLGIGKATVFAVIGDVRAGRFPGYEDLAELTGDMRDLAVNLRKVKIATIEAVGILRLLKTLSELGVEPSQLDAWVIMCQSIARDKGPAGTGLIQEAIRLASLQAENGMSYAEVVSKYTACVSDLKELGPKMEAARAELAQLLGSKETLARTCQQLREEKDRLEADKGQLAGQAKQQSNRCQELERHSTDLQTVIAHMEEKDGRFKEQLSHFEGKLAATKKEIDERTLVLSNLESLGFSKAQLTRLRTRLGELEARYGKEGLADRFFDSIVNYDSCLGMASRTEALKREMDAVTKQKEALLQFAEKLNLSQEEVAEGLVALKDLRNKGVMPGAVVSYQRLLEDSGMDPHSFRKVVTDMGGVERTLVARRGELEAVTSETETKRLTLDKMKQQEAATREYVASLTETAAMRVKELSSSTATELAKLCQGLQRDIVSWGDVRAEIGKCTRELELARCFVSLPISEEGVSNLVRDIDVGIIAQYLILCRAWCQAKFNPKRKPPAAIARKYLIGNYVQMEVTDVITWALMGVAEGN